MKKFVDLLKKYPLLNCFIAIFFSMVAIKSIPTETYVQMCILRMLLCGTLFFFLSFISGDKTINSCGNSTGYVIKVAVAIWLLALPLGLLGLVAQLAEAETIRPDWPISFLPYFYYLCSSVFLRNWLSGPSSMMRCYTGSEIRKMSFSGSRSSVHWSLGLPISSVMY